MIEVVILRFVKSIILTNMFCLAALPAAMAAPAVPVPPQAPTAQNVDKDTVVSSPVETKNHATGKLQFVLHTVRFAHSEMALDDVALGQLVEPFLQREITPAELNAMLDQLTAYARLHGYPAAIAYIPAQTAVKGNLTVQFAPGQLGKIQVADNSVLNENVVRRTLAGLKKGEVIKGDKLERAVRNLKDVPGIEVSASLVPGENSGESDLLLSIMPKDRDAYILYSENYGSKATGRYRYGVLADWRNISHKGDRLNIGGLVSNGKQHGCNIGYELPAGHSATTLGIGYSRTDYELGSIWSQLGMEGKSDTFSLYGKTPLRNQVQKNLNLVYAFNYRRLEDKMKGLELGNRHSYSVTCGLDGRYRKTDNLLQYNIALQSGTLTPDSALANTLATDGAYKGHYLKGTLDVTDIQKLAGPFDVLLKVSGQKAASNLDSSEHIYLGGARGIRAYPQGEASGDEGVLGTCEFRYHTNIPGLTLSTYYDAGHVREQKSVSGSTTLQGWGIGLTYSKENDWFARVDYARRIGTPDNLSTDAKSRQRIWFLAGKVF